MQSKNYRFALEAEQQWLSHLNQHGFVVIANVIGHEEVNHTTNLFWQWLQALGSGIKREDPQTWTDNNWPGSGSIGFFVSYGGCHTQAAWYLRTHPKVKSAFASIWKTPELITSFDTMICWRPWWNPVSASRWNPYVQNLHVDQNPACKKGFHCVQGMIPLVDVQEGGPGGLQVVADTNNDKTQQQIIQRYSWIKNSSSDWVQLRGNDPLIGKGSLVQCKAGDLILFDSRTIHGGKICEPSQQFKEANRNKLARLAMTVTMVPRDLQSQGNKQRRLKAFQNRIGLTHWPQQFNKSSFGSLSVNINRDKIVYNWPTLTPEIEGLI